MDNANCQKINTNGKTSGHLVDISESHVTSATISPNAVRNRIANPASNNKGAFFCNGNYVNVEAFAGSSMTTASDRFGVAVPGSVHRVNANPTGSKGNGQQNNVIERHLVRRTYEESYHSTRQTAVGSRLAADASPDRSIAGDMTAENFDALSLQQRNCRTGHNDSNSSTMPSTPHRMSQPRSHIHPDLISLQNMPLGSNDNTDNYSDPASQLQAELKRSLESSNSTFTSLVDLSAPVTKWKRAMSLPQNDFQRAMCHRAVAKSLAQNIRSALRSSPSAIKETLVSSSNDILPPPYEEVPQEQQQPEATLSEMGIGKLISPQMSPTTAEPNKNPAGAVDDEDIWIMREAYVDKLEETDRQWKAQQILEEQKERRIQTDTNKRMSEFSRSKQFEVNGAIDESLAAVLNTRRSSQESSHSGLDHSSSKSSHSMGSATASYSRLRNEASAQNQSRPSNFYRMGGDEISDLSDRDDEPESQPSLLRPFANLLAGRKGAYSKVPVVNDGSPVHQSQAASSSRQHYNSNNSRSGPEARRHMSDDRRIQSNFDETSDYPDEAPMPRNVEDFDTDEETDKLLERGYQSQRQIQLPELAEHALSDTRKKVMMKEVRLADPDHPSVLLEGVLFRCRYLGSTQLVSDSQPSKSVRMMQAQEAVGRIKAPFGEAQPSTEVDLFISFEKVMVLSTNLQDIIMDHALKTISYVADLDDVVVLMTRRRQLPEANTTGLSQSSARGPQLKMLCHVFECEDAHHISDAIGEAFHLAYMSFLRANGIEDPNALREVDMSEENVGPQDIFNDDLPRFVDKNHQKDVVVSKPRGEPLGIVVVESGWGSVIPTVVVANMLPSGPASRSGQLNIGDQLLSVNGISLVGLPMTSCQNYIKAAKNQTAVRITLIRCPPVTEVLIKRPDIKYQLGFSVHNGIICSLLRGGIAERGGVRVGHRIIEINGESVVAVSHDRIVNLLSSSIGEIRMKTMPMSIFRLLTGQDAPNYI